MQALQVERLCYDPQVDSGVLLNIMLPKRFVESGLRPDTLTITIRHSDWLGAEQSLRWALTLNKESVYAVLDLKAVAGVKTFNLELEAFESQKAELNKIVQCARSLHGNPRRTNPMAKRHGPCTRFVPSKDVREWQWQRPAKLGGDKDGQVVGSNDSTSLKLHVVG